MTQRGQFLVLDEILGRIYIFFPCICWIIAFRILQEYLQLLCLIMMEQLSICFFVKMSPELGHHLLLLRAVVVEEGSNINSVCALSLAVGDVHPYHFPYALC